jgi:hypothetical protein
VGCLREKLSNADSTNIRAAPTSLCRDGENKEPGLLVGFSLVATVVYFGSLRGPRVRLFKFLVESFATVL